MFEKLSEQIEKSLHRLKGRHRITEINISESLKDIRRALINADVNYNTAKNFIQNVKEKALGQKVIESLRPDQQIVKIVHDELVELMGGESEPITFKQKPSISMIIGLQGSGKTTFSSKLAKFYKDKKNKKVLLVAADVYRPAAVDQLKLMGEKVEVEVFSIVDEKNVSKLVKAAQKHAVDNKFDHLIIDTAGRLSIDQEKMDEIKAVKSLLSPEEILFVVDAMTGQDAVKTAKIFNENMNYSGVVLTKMDGDTKGGAALSIKVETGKSILYISNGEKPENLDVFYPKRMADRILGMGDMLSFVEKVQEQYDEESSRSLNKKISQNSFDFNDFLTQMKSMKKLGSVKDIMGMIPGMSKMAKNVDVDDDKFKKIEVIIYSMSKEERSNPDVINMSRKQRIAKGSGSSIEEVNQLIKNFSEMKKMMKSINSGNMSAIKNLSGMMKGGMPKI